MEKKRIKEDAEQMNGESAPKKDQLAKESNIFKTILIVMSGFVLMFLVIYGIKFFSTSFNVEGVSFQIDTESVSGMTLYKTSVPVFYRNELTGKAVTADYNFWLRTDPRELEEIEFNGEVLLKTDMVVNQTEEFICDGDGTIGLANVLNLYDAIGTTVIKDENASCDSQGRYAYVTILSGEETGLEQVGPACYNIYVKDCEILKATEKFMLETLKKTNEELKKD